MTLQEADGDGPMNRTDWIVATVGLAVLVSLVAMQVADPGFYEELNRQMTKDLETDPTPMPNVYDPHFWKALGLIVAVLLGLAVGIVLLMLKVKVQTREDP